MTGRQERARRWIVLSGEPISRWGGDLRRRHIFARLAERTSASVVDQGWYPVLLRRAARGRLGFLPGPLLYRLPSRGPKPLLASSEKLRERLLDTARAVTDPAVVAIYDDAAAQSRALGVAMDPGWLGQLRERQRRNLDTFRSHVVPTRSFAELIGLDLDRVIIGGNGTDTRRIVPGPWPEQPAIGVVSGAAPGRGLELLIEATRLARETMPELLLRMWLVATGEESEKYLATLRNAAEADPWISIEAAPYDRLSEALASASALCITHPSNDYMDVALPVKLFDSLAAGRPLIVTPRLETTALLHRHDVGVVASGDSAADVATAIVETLSDPDRLRALGARARDVAVREFDWTVVGDRIADAVLERERHR